MKTNYIQTEEGKWYHFTRKDNLVCCDCCLSHKIRFKIVDGKIYIKFLRDDRATAGYRRNKEAQKTIKSISKKLH
jgi:hypothetical protein